MTLALSMLAAGVVTADSKWGSFEGYPKAKFFVNNKEIPVPEGGVPAFVIDGSTVLPLRQVADAMQAIVKWDNTDKTAYIYKPNVSMFVAQDVSSNTVKKTFGKVDVGKSMSFVVFVQADNLQVNASGLKITIEDPYGAEVGTATAALDTPRDNFWFTSPFEINFTESGNYKIKFALNVDGSYTTVAEKLIVSE